MKQFKRVLASALSLAMAFNNNVILHADTDAGVIDMTDSGETGGGRQFSEPSEPAAEKVEVQQEEAAPAEEDNKAADTETAPEEAEEPAVSEDNTDAPVDSKEEESLSFSAEYRNEAGEAVKDSEDITNKVAALGTDAVTADVLAPEITDYKLETVTFNNEAIELLHSEGLKVAGKEWMNWKDTGSNPVVITFTYGEEETESIDAAPAEEVQVPVTQLSTVSSDGKVTVTLSMDAGANIPEGTTVVANAVTGSSLDNAVAQAAEALNEDKENVVGVAYDIYLLTADGQQIQPDEKVHVSMAFNQPAALDLPENAEVKDSAVVHIHDGEARAVEGTAETTADGTAVTSADFTTDSFSIFVASYTVIYHYDGFEYVMPGDTSVKLSAVLSSLGIAVDAEDISNVVFTDPALVQVSKDTEDNGWTLASLEHFDTDEKLTVTLNEGTTYEIKVTDPEGEGINQRAAISVTADSAKEMGQTGKFTLASSVASTTQAAAGQVTFHANLTGFDPSTMTLKFDANDMQMTENGSVTYNGHTYTLKKNGNDYYIEYTLDPGDTVTGVIFAIETKNGISGKKKTVTVTPSIVDKKETDSEGTAASINWTGDFAWDNLSKNVDQSVLNAIAGSSSAALNTDLVYTLTANSNNRKTEGAVFTDYVEIEDTVTLPTGVTFESGTFTASGSKITNNGKEILNITNLPAGATITVDSEASSQNTLKYKVTIPSDKKTDNVPTDEMSDVNLSVKLNATNLNVTKETSSGTISNTATITEYPYNDSDKHTSTDTAETTITSGGDSFTGDKTATATVNKGGIIDYTVTAIADTYNTAEGAQNGAYTKDVTDTLPEGLTLVDAEGHEIQAGDSVTVGGKTATVTKVGNQTKIVWKNQTINSRQENTEAEKWSVSFKAKVSSNYTGTTVVNSAMIDNITFSATTSVTQPDLVPEKTTTQTAPVSQGDTVPYTITVKNKGQAAAPAGTWVEDIMPAELIPAVSDNSDLTNLVTNSEPENTNYTMGTKNVKIWKAGDGYHVKWQTGDIAANGSETFTYNVKVGNVQDKIDKNSNLDLINKVSIGSNSDIETVKIKTPQTTVTKTDDKEGKAKNGDTINYTITVTNSSSTDSAANVKVTDEVDKYLDLYADGADGQKITQNGTYTIGGKQATVAIGEDGKKTITWRIDSIVAGGSQTLTYKTIVNIPDTDTTPNVVKNKAYTPTSSVDHDQEIEQPKVDVDKTASSPTDNQAFNKDDIVTYTITANNTSDTAATHVEVTDTLPKGLTVVYGDSNTEITTSGTYTIDGQSAAVTIGGNGAATVKFVIDSLDAKGQTNASKTFTIKAKVTDNTLPKLKNTVNTNYGGSKSVDINVHSTTDIDKKAVDAEGHDAEVSRINNETSTLTYYVRLINDSDQQQTFTNVNDNLPWFIDTSSNNLTYYFNGSGSGDIPVAVADVTGTFAYNEKNLTIVSMGSAQFDSNDTHYLKWGENGSVTVAADSAAVAKITLTLSKEVLQKILARADAHPGEFSTYGNRVTNTFHADGYTDRKVPVEVGDQGQKSFYIQKGVEKLSTVASSGNGSNFSFSSGSLNIDKTNTRKTYYYRDANDNTFVVYYVALYNTNKEPVHITSIVDTLPQGVSYIGLVSNLYGGDFYKYDNNADPKNSYNDNSITNSSLALKENAVVYASGNASGSNYDYQYPLVANTSVSGPARGSTGTIQFALSNGSAENGYGFAGYSRVNFAYLCKVDTSNADNAASKDYSTNTVSVITSGNVSQQKPTDTKAASGNELTITSSQATSDGTNDGSCSHAYNVVDDTTTFTSSVTIYPIETNSIKPGITKTALQYSNDGTTWTDIADTSQFTGNEYIKWRIELRNSGAKEMPIDYVEDTVTTPVAGKNPEITSASLTAYNADGTQDSTNSVADLKVPSATVSGNNYTYKFDLSKAISGNTAVTLKQNCYAYLDVVTKPIKDVGQIVNSATLKPKDKFDSFTHGESSKENDSDSNYYLLTDQDSVTGRAKQGTSAWKTITGTRYDPIDPNVSNKTYTTNTASSVDSDSGTNYIRMNAKGQQVTYTLNIYNQGSSALNKLVIIDNNPYDGDVGPVNAEHRGSEFSVSGFSNLRVVLETSDGNTMTLANGDSGYSVQYGTKKNNFTSDDYMGTSTDTWTADSSTADSMRIIINREVPGGATVRASYTATIGNDAETGDIAWNSFGYYRQYVDDENQGKYEKTRNAAPARVGVTIEATLTNLTINKIANNQPDDHKNDSFTFKIRFTKADNEGNKKTNPTAADIVKPATYVSSAVEYPITYDSDGYGTLTLTGGQTVKINGLPSGVFYDVQEVKNASYSTSATGTTVSGETTSTVNGTTDGNGTTVSGKLPSTGAETTFTNNYQNTGDLTIHKSLIGKASGTFYFTVSKTVDGTTAYYYMKDGKLTSSNTLSSAVVNTLDYSSTNNSVTLTGLEPGIYTVAETDANGSAAASGKVLTVSVDSKYLVKAGNAEGSLKDGTETTANVEAGKTAYAYFSNTPLTSYSVKKNWTAFDGTTEAAPPESTEVTVKLQQKTETGDWTDVPNVTKTINKVNWTAVFDDLPAYDSDGNAITYRAVETDMGAAGNTFEMTNNGEAQPDQDAKSTGNDSGVITNKQKPGALKIQKTDGRNNLDGATFKVTDSEGKTFRVTGSSGVYTYSSSTSDTETSSLATNSDGLLTIDGLAAGTYKVTEVSAPAAHIKDASEHTITVSAGTTAETADAVSISNTPTGQLTINKIVTGNTAPADAEYTVTVTPDAKNANKDLSLASVKVNNAARQSTTPNNTITFSIKKNETAVVEMLPLGTYKVEESAGADYKTQYSITVTDNAFTNYTDDVPAVSLDYKSKNASAGIKNIYPDQTTKVISGNKTLIGRNANNGEFTFEISGITGTGSVDQDTVNATLPAKKTATAPGAAGAAAGAAATFSFDPLTFKKTGKYIYEIKEKAGSAAGVTYDQTVYHAAVTVTKSEDGTRLVASEPVITMVKNAAGTAVAETPVSGGIAFSNNFETGSLLVSKTLKGNGANLTREFSFTVTLTDSSDAPLAGTYTAEKKDKNGATTTTSLTFTLTGEAPSQVSSTSFTLQGGESMEIKNLPSGSKYTVTEADYSKFGYSTKINSTETTGRVSSGEIAKNNQSTAAYENERNSTGILSVEKKVEGTAAETGKRFKFKVTLTGEYGSSYSGSASIAKVSGHATSDADGSTELSTLTFTNGESADFYLGKDDKIEISGLPNGALYSVTEENGGYHQAIVDNDAATNGASASDGQGTITEKVKQEVTFTNTKNTYGGFTIQKFVTGNDATNKKWFPFAVTLYLPHGVTLQDGTYGDLKFRNVKDASGNPTGVMVLDGNQGDADSLSSLDSILSRESFASYKNSLDHGILALRLTKDGSTWNHETNKVSVTGLPNGTVYKVEEDWKIVNTDSPSAYTYDTVAYENMSAAITRDAKGQVTSAVVNKGIAVEGVTESDAHDPASISTYNTNGWFTAAHEVKVTNSRDRYGSLKILKAVESNLPSAARQSFTIRVKLYDADGTLLTGTQTFGGHTFTNGVYEQQITDNDTSKSSKTDPIEKAKKEASSNVIEITGLPLNYKYKIYEVDKNNQEHEIKTTGSETVDGYTATAVETVTLSDGTKYDAIGSDSKDAEKEVLIDGSKGCYATTEGCTGDNQGIQRKDNPGKVEKAEMAGTFTSIKPRAFYITNANYRYGGFKVAKTVNGKENDDKQFLFHATVYDPNFTGYVVDASGTHLKSDANGTNDAQFAKNTDNVSSSATFVLKNGESAYVEGLNEGTSYAVYESDYTAEGYTGLPDSNENSPIRGTIAYASDTLDDINTQAWAAKIDDVEANAINVINTYAVGDLSITKALAGNDQKLTTGRKFLFKVELKTSDNAAIVDDSSEGVQYSATITYPDKTKETKTYTFYNGICGDDTHQNYIELTKPATVVISGIPSGYRYTVTEVPDNSSDDNPYGGFKSPSYSGETGQINNNQPAIVTVTNTKNSVGQLKIEKEVTGNAASTTDNFTFTVTVANGGTDFPKAGENYGVDFTGSSGTGTATVTLNGGDNSSKTISNLPNGAHYTVTENQNSLGYISTQPANWEGDIVGGASEPITVRYENKRDVSGSLQLEKLIAGNAADMNGKYSFQITLKNASGTAITGTYPAKLNSNDVAGGIAFDSNGINTTEIKLGNTDKLVITGLPICSYTVVETGDNSSAYTTSYKRYEGTTEEASESDNTDHKTASGQIDPYGMIADTGFSDNGQSLNQKEDQNIVFTNTLNTYGGLKIAKVIKGNAADKTKKFTFTVKLTDGNELKSKATVDAVKFYKSEDNSEITGRTATRTEGTDNSVTYSFELTDGEYAVITGLPNRTFYQVSENQKDYTQSISPSNSEKGLIKGFTDINKKFDVSNQTTFTNTKDTFASVTITKLLTGNSQESSRTFEFTVESDPALNGLHSSESDDIVFANGKASVQITGIPNSTAGASKKITGLPNGTKLKITELNYSQDGYDAPTFKIIRNNGAEEEYTAGNEIALTGGDDIIVKATNNRDKGTLTVKKTFAGATLTDAQKNGIKFVVTNNSGYRDEKSYSDMANGSYTWTGLELGTYTVAETNADIPGYSVAATYKVGNTETKTVNVTSSGAEVDITNTYTQLTIDKSLQVTKTVTGDINKMSAEEKNAKFKFMLEAVDDAPMPSTGTEVEIAAGGTGNFGTVTYNAVGNYYYKITETTASGITGMTYDNTEKYAKVAVIQDGSKLKADVTYGAAKKACDAADAAGTLTVTNKYGKTTAHPEVVKAMRAGSDPLPDGTKFEFEITAGTGKDGSTDLEVPMPASNKAEVTGAGTAEFGDITFTHKGTYTYTIREKKPSSELTGMTYSDEVITATAEVTQADDGKLTAVFKYKNGETDNNNTITNTYVVPTGSLQISKTVTGSGDTSKEFNFTVEFKYEPDGTYGSEPNSVVINKGVFTDTFKLKNGESRTYTKLPIGMTYKVTEDDYSGEGYSTTVNGKRTGSIEGTIELNSDSKTGYVQGVKFVNDKPSETPTPTPTPSDTPSSTPTPTPPEFHPNTQLIVRKVVVGGDVNKYWTFDVYLDQNISGQYGSMLFANGHAVISMKSGEEIGAFDLPAGTTYKVYEREANTGGYTTTANGAEGTLVNGGMSIAVFTNSTSSGIPDTSDNFNLFRTAGTAVTSLIAAVGAALLLKNSR